MSNPMLNEERFSSQTATLDSEPMTINGTVNKIFMLFICLIAGAAISLYYMFSPQASLVPILMTGSAIIGFILVLITCFNIKIAKYTAAPYALLEGILLGGVSMLFENVYQGIVLQAILGTFTVLFVMLLLYKSKIIRYTERFAAILMTSLLSICAIYLIQIVASLFGHSIPGIFGAGVIGIGFSLLVIIIAAMALIQDFAFIENASNQMLSKDYEWYGAMGLMITMIWLYMEILNLLAKLNSRR